MTGSKDSMKGRRNLTTVVDDVSVTSIEMPARVCVVADILSGKDRFAGIANRAHISFK